MSIRFNTPEIFKIVDYMCLECEKHSPDVLSEEEYNNPALFNRPFPYFCRELCDKVTPHICLRGDLE
jgi:hypothetical protein